MQFEWSPYELHIEGLNEVNVVYTCNTNEVDMRLINSSHEIHMKFIWISNDLNFMWNPCELHKIYMKSTQEVPLYYTWIWFLASLLCTSYEWASRSIVNMPNTYADVSSFLSGPLPKYAISASDPSLGNFISHSCFRRTHPKSNSCKQ